MVARGEQQIACMRRHDGKLLPAPVPEALRDALRLRGVVAALLAPSAFATFDIEHMRAHRLVVFLLPLAAGGAEPA